MAKNGSILSEEKEKISGPNGTLRKTNDLYIRPAASTINYTTLTDTYMVTTAVVFVIIAVIIAEVIVVVVVMLVVAVAMIVVLIIICVIIPVIIVWTSNRKYNALRYTYRYVTYGIV